MPGTSAFAASSLHWPPGFPPGRRVLGVSCLWAVLCPEETHWLPQWFHSRVTVVFQELQLGVGDKSHRPSGQPHTHTRTHRGKKVSGLCAQRGVRVQTSSQTWVGLALGLQTAVSLNCLPFPGAFSFPLSFCKSTVALLGIPFALGKKTERDRLEGERHNWVLAGGPQGGPAASMKRPAVFLDTPAPTLPSPF